ncbi:hypothetical protein JMUB4039_1315 [Leptotrichia trevisanii]|uniref:hypothetical protein n=1 Tax=Leptotrichia trevisanii TaxID=109328 RepID=UPI00118C2AC5|nr:hypothetical protein [Leptotrichia trevisanii]BBM57336.1 hypothetical protein JMUB4039_1315 [Leptotrichia trevisanii]
MKKKILILFVISCIFIFIIISVKIVSGRKENKIKFEYSANELENTYSRFGIDLKQELKNGNLKFKNGTYFIKLDKNINFREKGDFKDFVLLEKVMNEKIVSSKDFNKSIGKQIKFFIGAKSFYNINFEDFKNLSSKSQEKVCYISIDGKKKEEADISKISNLKNIIKLTLNNVNIKNFHKINEIENLLELNLNGSTILEKENNNKIVLKHLITSKNVKDILVNRKDFTMKSLEERYKMYGINLEEEIKKDSNIVKVNNEYYLNMKSEIFSNCSGEYDEGKDIVKNFKKFNKSMGNQNSDFESYDLEAKQSEIFENVNRIMGLVKLDEISKRTCIRRQCNSNSFMYGYLKWFILLNKIENIHTDYIEEINPITRNQIKDFSYDDENYDIIDIKELDKLKNLEDIYIYRKNRIKNIEYVQYLKNLKMLYIPKNIVIESKISEMDLKKILDKIKYIVIYEAFDKEKI